MQLLDLFKELTVHPANAEELKGLILQLAVQGKLTKTWREKNPDVEPASVLIENIKRKKAIQVKEKKIRKEKPLAPIKENEIPYELPKNWVWSYLGEIGNTNVGLTYKPAHKTPKGVPVLRSSNIQNGEIDLNDLVRVNTTYREKDLVNVGDLLICARNGSRKLVGKCAIIKELNETMVFGAFMALYRSDFNEYLELFIQSPLYRARLDGVETTTINQITQGNLKSTIAPLPPFEEQKAIVHIVSELFKEVEELEEKTIERIQLKEDFVSSALHQLTSGNTANQWTYLQEHFKTFFTEKSSVQKLREAILQLAVQGKLTKHWREQNPNVEPASVLLENIKAEKAQLVKEKKIKKEKPLPPITEDEIPYELPEGWEYVRLGDIGDWGAGATPKRSISSYYGGHINWFKSGELNNGLMDYDSEEKITSLALENSSLRMNQVGDVLIAMYGATIGKTGLLAVEGTTNQAVCACTTFSGIDNKFLLLLLQALKPEFTNQGAGGAQPNISRVKIRMTTIILPPDEEQKAIVQIVNQLLELCDSLETEIEQQTNQIEELMKSCLGEVIHQ